MIEHKMWVEKYRPDRIKDCVLPDRIKKIFTRISKDKSIEQHLLLNGPPGCGKTTIALALANELDADVYFINASLDAQIDVLRNNIDKFCSSVSLEGKQKIIVLDEADGISLVFAKAIRGILEKFSRNCMFILTCNDVGHLTDAIKSRCSVIDFSLTKKERSDSIVDAFKRMCYILETENVSFDKKVLASVTNTYFPDTRLLINELQVYSKNGQIDTGMLAQIKSDDVEDVIPFLKNKDFASMRQFVAQNADKNLPAMMLKLNNSLYNYLDDASIPQVCVLTNNYQISASQVVSQELNMVAYCVEIMVGAEWK